MFVDIVDRSGRACWSASLARMHEARKYYKLGRGAGWTHSTCTTSFYTKPVEHAEGKGFGSTEAARGS